MNCTSLTICEWGRASVRVSNVTIRRRLWYAMLGGTVLFAALIIRLAYVQLWMGPDLAEKAEESWRRNIPFEAKRGEVWDRNGVKLTYNVSTPTIMAIPAQIKDPEGTARQLAQVLQISEQSVLDILKKRSMIERIQPGGRKISPEKAEEVNKLKLPGIVVAEDNKRYFLLELWLPIYWALLELIIRA